jgi:hypothetical protein
MFWTFSMLLMVLWLMGMVTGYTFDGLIHVLPVIAVVSAILGGMRRQRRHPAPRIASPTSHTSY